MTALIKIRIIRIRRFILNQSESDRYHCAKGTRETASVTEACIAGGQEQNRNHCITWKSESNYLTRTTQNNIDERYDVEPQVLMRTRQERERWRWCQLMRDPTSKSLNSEYIWGRRSVPLCRTLKINMGKWQYIKITIFCNLTFYFKLKNKKKKIIYNF